MKVTHDTTKPARDGFTLGASITSRSSPYPEGTHTVHLLLRHGGTEIDLPVEEARQVVGLLVEKINEVDSGAFWDRVRQDYPGWPDGPIEIRGPRR